MCVSGWLVMLCMRRWSGGGRQVVPKVCTTGDGAWDWKSPNGMTIVFLNLFVMVAIFLVYLWRREVLWWCW